MSVALATVLASIVMAAPVAAQYPATSGPLNVTVTADCEWIVSGSGYAPGAIVDLELSRDTAPFTQVTADATGTFVVTVTVTHEMPRGRQDLVATGANPGGGLHVLSASVVVPRGCGGNNSTGLGIGFLRPPSGPSGPNTALVALMLAAALAVTTLPQRTRTAAA